MQMRFSITADPVVMWLQMLGLETNPFDSRYLDAGADPAISSYLIGHEKFDALWKDQNSLVFAPVGGGKSSFRVRLTHACRIGQDGRRIFPIVYKLPEPDHFSTRATVLEQHYHFIAQKMATELLLLLLYRPEKWHGITTKEQQQVALQLWFALRPVEPSALIEQLYETGSYAPMLASYDPTASCLPAPPNPETVRAVCSDLLAHFAHLQTPTQPSRQPTPHQQFDGLTATVRATFEYEALYLLVDGVDAYAEITEHPRRAIEILEPLWRETTLVDYKKIYLKYFLPTELKSAVTIPIILPYGSTLDATLVDIQWTEEWLLDLLAARIRVASQGRFDNLNAISAPVLRNVHLELVNAVRNSPREVLVLAERLLWEHVHRPEAGLRLEPEDLQRAQAWYQQQKQGVAA